MTRRKAVDDFLQDAPQKLKNNQNFKKALSKLQELKLIKYNPYE